MPRSAHEHDLPLEDLSQDELELVIRERLGPDADLIEVIKMGDAMLTFVGTPAGAHLLAEATKDLTEATQALLDSDTLGDKVSQAAHFKARVARQVLRYIDEAIQVADEAQRQIESRDLEGE